MIILILLLLLLLKLNVFNGWLLALWIMALVEHILSIIIRFAIKVANGDY